MNNPAPEEIRAARAAAGLSQTAAAELVHSKLRTWQQWEAGDRRMHPGLWELFRLKIAAALTAQSAVGEEIMVNAAHDVFTLPLQPSGLSSGPRFVVHVPVFEQQVAEIDALRAEVEALRAEVEALRELEGRNVWAEEFEL